MQESTAQANLSSHLLELHLSHGTDDTTSLGRDCWYAVLQLLKCAGCVARSPCLCLCCVCCCLQLIFFPSAIGSEPDEPAYNSYPHWVRTMCGHAAANLVSETQKGGSEMAASLCVHAFSRQSVCFHHCLRLPSIFCAVLCVLTMSPPPPNKRADPCDSQQPHRQGDV